MIIVDKVDSSYSTSEFHGLSSSDCFNVKVTKATFKITDNDQISAFWLQDFEEEYDTSDINSFSNSVGIIKDILNNIKPYVFRDNIFHSLVTVSTCIIVHYRVVHLSIYDYDIDYSIGLDSYSLTIQIVCTVKLNTISLWVS